MPQNAELVQLLQQIYDPDRLQIKRAEAGWTFESLAHGTGHMGLGQPAVVGLQQEHGPGITATVQLGRQQGHQHF